MSRWAQPETGPQSHSGVTSRAQIVGHCPHGYLVTPGGACPLCEPTRASREQDDGRFSWTPGERFALKSMYESGVEVPVICERLHKTERAVMAAVYRNRLHRILEEER